MNILPPGASKRSSAARAAGSRSNSATRAASTFVNRRPPKSSVSKSAQTNSAVPAST